MNDHIQLSEWRILMVQRANRAHLRRELLARVHSEEVAIQPLDGLFQVDGALGGTRVPQHVPVLVPVDAR
jgi:hypothetical protein